jgi:hypothetical protein
MQTLRIPVFTLLIGLLIGWGLHSFVASPETSPEVAASGDLSAAQPKTAPMQNSASGAANAELQSDKTAALGSSPQSSNELLKAFRGALTAANPRSRVQEFIGLLDSITPENAQAIRALLADWPKRGPAESLCKQLFFQRWGEVDGERALVAMETGLYGENGNECAEAIAQGWASKDLASVRRYAEAIAVHDPKRIIAVRAIVDAVMQRDISEAAAFAFAQPDIGDEFSRETLNALFARARSLDRSDIFGEWFEHAPEGPLKPILAQQTVNVLQATDPAAAAAWLTRMGEPEWREWDLYWPTAEALAAKDPKAAMDWIMSIPRFPDEPAPPGLKGVVKTWYHQDAPAVMSWLDSTRDAPWWPRAVNGIVDDLTDTGRANQIPGFLQQFSPEMQAAISADRRKPKAVQTRR